ncbi:MAG TPA: ribosome maturation factor RimM [Acidimicrobiia bacterium]|nr:ribosome maturation factor RimM [Acidimicrobiia bacterium]
MDVSTLPDNFLRIAKCGRVVGLKGEIALWPISNVDERFLVGSELFCEDGTKLSIDAIRPHKDHYVVLFSGNSSREDVEPLTNVILYAPALDEDVLDDGEFFVHDCIGKKIVDQEGREHGIAEKYIPSAASDLLESDEGILIPFRFITRVDDDIVYVDAPEGLFDVNDKDFS